MINENDKLTNYILPSNKREVSENFKEGDLVCLKSNPGIPMTIVSFHKNFDNTIDVNVTYFDSKKILKRVFFIEHVLELFKERTDLLT